MSGRGETFGEIAALVTHATTRTGTLRAKQSEPRLLLLDEPSLGLAPVVVQMMFRTLAEIRKQGLTVLIVEQNVQRTLRLADRAYVLEQGRIVLTGTGAELMQDPQVRKAYLAL